MKRDLLGPDNRLAELGVHAIRADHHVRISHRPVAEAQMHHGAVQFHIGELLAELDRTWLDFFQDRRMQIVAVNGDVAGAVISLARSRREATRTGPRRCPIFDW